MEGVSMLIIVRVFMVLFGAVVVFGVLPGVVAFFKEMGGQTFEQQDWILVGTGCGIVLIGLSFVCAGVFL
jgi:hypothetical protein